MSDINPERWLPVVGLEGFFEVSDRGRVRSVTRRNVYQSHRLGKPFVHERIHKGRILKLGTHPRRAYKQVVLSADGIRRYCKVHHLVLEAFVGPCPDGMECCHKNDDPSDNRLENLRWDTHEENMRDRALRGADKRTHCKRGHEFTPENIMWLKTPIGGRRCRKCARHWHAVYRTQRRAAS